MRTAKNIVILGSTGSVGENAVLAAKSLSGKVNVVGLGAGSNHVRVAEQAKELNCGLVALADPVAAAAAKELLPPECEILAGGDAMVELATKPEVDLVLCAIVGAPSLRPAFEAVKAGKTLALASKEALVMAGHIIMAEAKKRGVEIIPVDSEHSAVAQCLAGRSAAASRIILTASGGPFLDWTSEAIARATVKDALAHPTWNMGTKISIDSATLMNKSLEIIEASHLFGLPAGKIDVVVHRQSIVHSMVEFQDGTVLAQMSVPDMRFPIVKALTWPDTLPNALPTLGLKDIANLTFEPPDKTKFPSLNFAQEVLRTGGVSGAALNAANEIAVGEFVAGRARFSDIWRIVEETLEARDWSSGEDNLEAILEADNEARHVAKELQRKRYPGL